MYRLVTIPMSHFCEKARWALDLSGETYVEEGHLPVLHWACSLGAGGGRTVPVLARRGGEALGDSSAILEALARAHPELELYGRDPAEAEAVRAWEELFDAKLGPAMRRWAYYHLMPDKALLLQLFGQGVPGLERGVFSALYPVFIAMMRKAMAIDAAGYARSLARTRDVFARVGEALSDGRRYLVGDRFSAADLSFAALAAPALQPPEHPVPLVPLERFSPALQQEALELQATPAGAYGLRLYAEHRPRRPPVTRRLVLAGPTPPAGSAPGPRPAP